MNVVYLSLCKYNNWMFLCDIPYAMLAYARHRRTSCRYSKDKIRRRLFCLSPYLIFANAVLDVKKALCILLFLKIDLRNLIKV